MIFDHDEQEKNLKAEYYRGRASSLEDASDVAKRRAGANYSAGDDVQAKLWRDVSNWLADEAGKERSSERKFTNPF